MEYTNLLFTRCGGQGDLLTGCLATFVAWAVDWSKNGKLVSVFRVN